MNLSEVQRVLAEHRFTMCWSDKCPSSIMCSCGWESSFAEREAWEAHLASVLAPETDKALFREVRLLGTVLTYEKRNGIKPPSVRVKGVGWTRGEPHHLVLTVEPHAQGTPDSILLPESPVVVGSSKEEQAPKVGGEAPPSPPSDTALFDALWRVLPFPIRHYFGGDEREAREGVVAMMARGFTATQEQLETIMRANQVSEPSRSTLSPTPDRQRLLDEIDAAFTLEQQWRYENGLSAIGEYPANTEQVVEALATSLGLAYHALRLPSGEQEAPKARLYRPPPTGRITHTPESACRIEGEHATADCAAFGEEAPKGDSANG